MQSPEAEVSAPGLSASPCNLARPSPLSRSLRESAAGNQRESAARAPFSAHDVKQHAEPAPAHEVPQSAAGADTGSPRAHASAALPATAFADTQAMRFAQLVIKDTETGKAYMLADSVRSPTGSALSQTLVDLDTNDRRTFEYNVLADERAASAPISANGVSALQQQESQRSNSRSSSKSTNGKSWCEPNIWRCCACRHDVTLCVLVLDLLSIHASGSTQRCRFLAAVSQPGKLALPATRHSSPSCCRFRGMMSKHAPVASSGISSAAAMGSELAAATITSVPSQAASDSSTGSDSPGSSISAGGASLSSANASLSAARRAGASLFTTHGSGKVQ